jgi:serine/threonine protein kinase
VGTTRFAAPEQLESKKQGGYGPKVDMYSLGVVLFDMFRDHNIFGRELEHIHELLKKG